MLERFLDAGDRQLPTARRGAATLGDGEQSSAAQAQLVET
jgi:hypothetical protein